MEKFIPSLIVSALLITQSLYADNVRVPQDYATIQAAIDASDQPRIIDISPGIYRENLTLKSRVTLRGQSTETTILTASEGKIIAIAEAQEITIENLRIDGKNKCKYGIFLIQTDLHGAPSSKILIQDNLIISMRGAGIFCDYASPTITNNHITEITGTGIEVHWKSPEISNNSITATSKGLYCNSGCASHVLENNFERNITSIDISHGASPLIESNAIIQSNRNGISVFHSTPTIINNLISESAWNGITFLSSGGTLNKNKIESSGINGIHIDASSTPTLGTKLNLGKNQVISSIQYHVKNENKWAVDAEGNWWGKSPPDSNKFDGKVNYQNWLDFGPIAFKNKSVIFSEHENVAAGEVLRTYP